MCFDFIYTVVVEKILDSGGKVLLRLFGKRKEKREPQPSGITGEKCAVSGTYYPLHNLSHMVTFEKGETFHPYEPPTGPAVFTTWVLVDHSHLSDYSGPNE